MSLAQWIRRRLVDDAKHAELDEREARTERTVEELRVERRRNGFGELFQEVLPPPRPHTRKGH